MDTVLAIDVGTQSIRGVLFSLQGEELFSASYSYSPKFLSDGKVRQSAEDWDRGVTDVLSRCGEYLNGSRHRVLGITLTSQRASVLPVDSAGRPLDDCFMWQDKTTSLQCDHIREKISDDEIYRITGLRNDPYFSAPKILWYRENEPSIRENAAKYIGVQDYVAYLLTGRFVTDWSQACRSMLLDVSAREWSSRMLEACSIERDSLPELVPPGSRVGSLQPDLAANTGLDPDVPVFLAGGDQQVAAVGMGVIGEGTVEANTGTGSFVIAPVQKPLLHPEARTLCSIAAIPDQWVVEAGALTTGILYSWFAREFACAGDEDESAALKELDRLVESSPPGAHGVIALPHFKGSAAPYWNHTAKGLFFNLSLSHSRADMARALLESIVLEMGAGLGRIREILPEAVTEVVVAGGLTKFEPFNQLQADVFDTKVRIPASTEATARGALISALVGLNVTESYQEACRIVLQGNDRYLDPDHENTEVYRKAAELREKLYTTLENGGVYSAAEDYNREISRTKED